MYGLSLIASLRCASVTLFLASAIFLARSSERPAAGAGARDGGAATEVAGGGWAKAAGPPGFFMAAILAATSARFWAISASLETYASRLVRA